MPMIQLIRKTDKEIIKRYLPQMFELDIQLNKGTRCHDTKVAFRNYLFGRHTTVILITIRKTVIGYAVVEMCESLERADITNVIVLHRFRGMGYGRVLVQRAIKLAKKTMSDKANVFIDVHTSNYKAKRLYKSLGFKTFYEQMQLK
jgi:ribosomal protein S18 acetylase RimI-like enzyme